MTSSTMQTEATANNSKTLFKSNTELSSQSAMRKESALEEGDENESLEQASTLSLHENADASYPRYVTGCLTKGCLSPRYSLCNQLFLSFGSVSIISLSFVMVCAIITALQAGKEVKSISRNNLEQFAQGKLKLKSKYLAEIIEQKVENYQSMVALIRETTRDRFSGYPDHPGYADDTAVPFTDVDTGINKYPLEGSPLPIDWNITSYMDDEDDVELLQGRSSWWDGIKTSAATGSIKFQGACDPSETDPRAHSYLEGCTEAHNDISTGGAVQPTPTLALIHAKASDYFEAVVRPIYEYHDEVKEIGVHFTNSGAGAIADYPGNRFDGTQTYTSAGCDWMKEANPLDATTPLGTADDIARCHPKGATVPLREYNPNERPWYVEQARNPNEIILSGPFEDAWHPGAFIFIMGQAIYDRITNKFIASMFININVAKFLEIIQKTSDADPLSGVSLVRWDGTVVASNRWEDRTRITYISEIEMGVDEDIFRKLKKPVDRLSKENYNPSAVYETIFANGVFISSAPVPIPPETYDPTYQPVFMVITTASGEVVLGEVDKLDDRVDVHVYKMIRETLIAGFVGLVAVIAVIYVVSLYLTKPLEWMHVVGDQIVHDFGVSTVKTPEYDQSRFVRFAPKTEISDLVDQFQRMIKKFSGKGVAKLFKKKPMEVRNPFDRKATFQRLYSARTREDFAYRYHTSSSDFALVPENSDRSNVAHRLNWGHNVKGMHIGSSSIVSTIQESLDGASERNNVLKSPLFWWIFGCTTIPLLLAMIAISVLVVVDLSCTFPDVTHAVEVVYFDLETDYLSQLTKLRAAYASEVMFAPLRDLFVLTRITGWLFFGALQRSDSYPTTRMAAESCKNSERGKCAYFDNPDLAVCACEWNDPSGTQCYDYDEVDVRSKQHIFCEGLREDNFSNGDRNFTSFPNVAFTSASTLFWSDQTAVPGAAKGNSATGHATTYDRMRVLSATSMIQIPLYNYATEIEAERSLGLYVGFEADGMLGGYAGCNHYHADASKWQSTGANSAELINPDLCPLGKFGFDSRCRGWYAAGKRSGQAGGDPLHVTPPYIHAGIESTASSATQALIDPNTGDYIGQTLIDFSSERIVKSLTQENTPIVDGIHLLISAQPDDQGADTIVAPGFDFTGLGGEETAAVSDFVLKYGEPENGGFPAILGDMHAGREGRTEFRRLTESDEEETVYLAYAPVEVKSLRPVDPSDMRRGVVSYTSHIYTLALGERAEGIFAAFDAIGDSLQETSRIYIGILCVVIALAAITVLYLSSRVAMSIIAPLSLLLMLTTKINRSEIKEDLPYIEGGSSEVSQVYQTFERLFMVVRFANTAFFSGDLLKAYENLTDALALFTKLDNSKAIGVTNNNLGNTMLTIYRTMKKTGAPTLCGLGKSEAIAKGIAYFDATIESGEKALAKTNEDEGWSTNYLIFMQQLSNRYFNRAMFLLTVHDDYPSPGDAERQGFTDLATAKDMDREVVDNGDQQGFKGDGDVYFDLLMSRIKGILFLIELGYEDEWGINELLVDASNELNAALKRPDDVLFRDLEPAAQMQRLDAALIRYYRLSEEKDREKAAEIAIRMLTEDEYVVGEAGMYAVKALIEFVADAKSENLNGEDPSNVRSALFQFRRQIADVMALTRNSRDVVGRESFRQSNIGDISMEIF